MPSLRIAVEVSDDFFHRYEEEARREGVKIEQLLEQTVNTLLKELEREEEVSPIDPS